MIRILFILITAGSLVLIQGCDSENNDNSNTIVCTTGMVGDAVKNLVRDEMEVQVLMGPGVDPHLYKAVHSDIEKLSKAKIVCYNGLHLEGKMTDVLENLNTNNNTTTIAFSDGVDEKRLRTTQGSAYDPHIWFDVDLWTQGVIYAGQQIAKNNPEIKDKVMYNLNRYLMDLDSLHLWVKAQLQQVPKESRVLITAHDAFGYFGRAYDIEVNGLQGISTVAQAGIKDRKDLVDLIIKRKIKAIFVETSISDKQLKAIVEDCKSRGHDVKIGGNLYSDAMGIEGSGADNYIGMVKTNVNTIVNALK